MDSFTYFLKESDLEAPHHHLHHAESLRILEWGRLQLLKAHGIDYQDYLSRGIFLVIVSIQVSYKRELFSGQITVRCSSPVAQGKSLSLKQEILNHKGKLAIEAEIALAFLSRESGRAIEPPAEFLNAFRREKS